MAKDLIPLVKSMAGHMLSPLQGKRRILMHKSDDGQYFSHFEGMSDEGQLKGWVFKSESGKGAIPIGIFAEEQLLEAGFANVSREDVRSIYGNEANCGFQFDISQDLYDKIIELGGEVTIKTLGQGGVIIGEEIFERNLTNPTLDSDDVSACRYFLKPHLSELLEAIEGDASVERLERKKPAFEHHQKLFSCKQLIPDQPETNFPAYLDYVRFRYRMDETFDLKPDLEVNDRYLHWYLTAYRGQEKHRVPVSAQHIDYLNAPIVMGGKRHSLSRVIWWRLTERPDLMKELNLHDRDCYLNILFWWANKDAPHLFFEDCLVPDRYADALRAVHPSRRNDAWPLNNFAERFYLDTHNLHFLDMGTAEGRKTLFLTMLLMAVERPDLLRYLPRELIEKSLRNHGEAQSDFEEFLSQLNKGYLVKNGEKYSKGQSQDTCVRLSFEQYETILRQKFFDLHSLQFMTRDQMGNRFEAAALSVPNPSAETVDIQLIGPLAKASGLGQAARLSADILRQTGLKVRTVDFDLDNPAPEGFPPRRKLMNMGLQKSI